MSLPHGRRFAKHDGDVAAVGVFPAVHFFNPLAANAVKVVSSTTVNGSTTLTAAEGDFSDIAVGAVISVHADIPGGTVVASITNAYTLEMDAAATGGSTADATFTGRTNGVNAHIYRVIADSVSVTGGGTEETFALVGGPQNTVIAGSTYAAQTKSLDSREDGSDVSVCQVGDSEGVAAVGDYVPDTTMTRWGMGLNSNYIWDIEKNPIVIKPGEGWIFKALGNDSVDMDVTFFWVEEPIL